MIEKLMVDPMRKWFPVDQGIRILPHAPKALPTLQLGLNTAASPKVLVELGPDFREWASAGAYNERRRWHSQLGYVSSIEYERMRAQERA